MKRNLITALMAVFLCVPTVHAENVSITPGTGNLGFDPGVTTVPEPTTAALILIGLLILAVLSIALDVLPKQKRKHRDSEHDRFADRAIYSSNPKTDPKVRR